MFSFSTKHVFSHRLLITLILFSHTALAQDLTDAAQSTVEQTAPIALNTASNDKASVDVQLDSAEIEAKEVLSDAEKQKALAHLKSLLSKKEDSQEVKKLSPYEQLVKLAFKGKGENGINSYEDAAKQFCQQARDDSDAEAQYALGWMHANGRGFEQDIHTAQWFYEMAAQQGNFRARKALAEATGDAKLAKTPACMQPDTPAEPLLAAFPQPELAPAGSNGNEFYQRGPIFNIVDNLAPQYHLETDLVMAFIKVESNFNPRATSPKNARGLMQLIPATARRFGVKDAYDPLQNIKGGMAYLQYLMAYFEGDVRLVAAAYNAGEHAVDRYKGVPPYKETRRYVSKIYNLYRKSFHPYKEDLLVGERSEVIRVSSHP